MRETTRDQYQETNNRCVQNRKSTGTETAYRDHNQGIHCFAERIERGREGERETERDLFRHGSGAVGDSRGRRNQRRLRKNPNPAETEYDKLGKFINQTLTVRNY